jgi:hypothetical protein
MFGATIYNLVAVATGRPGFMHLLFKTWVCSSHTLQTAASLCSVKCTIFINNSFFFTEATGFSDTAVY